MKEKENKKENKSTTYSGDSIASKCLSGTWLGNLLGYGNIIPAVITAKYPNRDSVLDFINPKYKHGKWDALDSALNNGDFVEVFNPADARWFTESYKNFYPSFYFGGNLPLIAKSGIKIKKKNRGKFTESAKEHGMGVQEYARKVLNDPNATPLQRKRANFARNASAWHRD